MIRVNRREFILGMSATAWSALYGRPAGEETLRARIGVMSDVHIYRKDDGSSKKFQLALDWCRASDVDAVLIAGDLSEEGFEEQLKHCADLYFSYFPDDKGRDGRDVARLIVTGNHDIGEFWRNRLKQKDEATIAACRARSLTHHRDRIWRACWNEPWSPVFLKRVKDIPFVGAHWGCWEKTALADFFATHPVDLSKPFLYAQHSHPRDTVYGDTHEDSDRGSSTAFFADKPNAIVFSGHSHRPVRSARAIWQGGFTSIATGAISQTFVASGCENSTFNVGRREPAAHMSALNGQNSATVLLVDVYADRLVIRRQNVVHSERIADDWVVPLPVKGEWSFAPRRAAAHAPTFPAGAKLTVARRKGRNRRREAEDQVVVTFPRATPAGRDTLVEKYRVTVSAGGKDVLVRHVYAKAHFFCEARVRATVSEESCVFGADEVPAGATIRVAPLDEWGHAGAELKA